MDVNYNINAITGTTFNIVLDSSISGLMASNLTISNPAVVVTSLIDSGDGLTYNVICGTLEPNISHTTTLEDGGTNTYTALDPLLNDVVYIQNTGAELDSDDTTSLEENIYYPDIAFPEFVNIEGATAEQYAQADAPVLGEGETVTTIAQKGENLLLDSGVNYKPNPNANADGYQGVYDASKVSDSLNPFDSNYSANVQDFIDRVEGVSNPSAGVYGHLSLIYPDDDLIANPYNIEGLQINTNVGIKTLILK